MSSFDPLRDVVLDVQVETGTLHVLTRTTLVPTIGLRGPLRTGTFQNKVPHSSGEVVVSLPPYPIFLNKSFIRVLTVSVSPVCHRKSEGKECVDESHPTLFLDNSVSSTSGTN